jgi:hypothetical protein
MVYNVLVWLDDRYSNYCALTSSSSSYRSFSCQNCLRTRKFVFYNGHVNIDVSILNKLQYCKTNAN